MRYHCDGDTLYLRGNWRAASTGIGGGLGNVSTILNHTVPADFDHRDPLAYIQGLLAAQGYGPDAFGLLTAVWMRNLCVLRYDFITIFVTAGVSNPNPNPNPDPTRPHTINVIAVCDEGMTDAALLETIITATEAKAHALRLLGRDFTGTTTDAVVVAAPAAAAPVHTYAGTVTEPGRRVYAAVLRGVIESLDRFEGRTITERPSLFVYSREDGGQWIEHGIARGAQEPRDIAGPQI
jgi:adenosylcobinamide hydrolase